MIKKIMGFILLFLFFGQYEAFALEPSYNAPEDVQELEAEKTQKDYKDYLDEMTVMLYVAEAKNDTLPLVTEKDIPEITAILPEGLQKNVRMIREILYAPSIGAQNDTVKIEIIRHIVLNMELENSFKNKNKEESEHSLLRSLSGEPINKSKFTEQRIGAYTAYIATAPSGKITILTSADPFISIQIETTDMVEATRILQQLSPQALSKVFKTDESKITVEESLKEVEQIMNNSDPLLKLRSSFIKFENEEN